mgnify:CR=1 FL=1
MANVDRAKGLVGTLGVKAPCVVATTAAITLYGAQTIAGVSVVAEDRVLVKDQVDTTANGIYVCQATTWVRAPDFDGSLDVLKSTMVGVAGGTQAQKMYRVTTANPIVIGTSALTFEAALWDSSADTIHAATGKATPVDADEFGIWDSVSLSLRKVTWANIKATLKAYFDTLYVALSSNQSIAGIKTFTDTTDASSSTAGGAIVSGGLAIAKKLFVGTLLDLSTATAGQIKFPATQNASADANTLDDYEEGTWTPSIGGTATYDQQTGHYVKTGRVVEVWGVLIINVIGTGSTTTISGLPFVDGNLGGTKGGSVTNFVSIATSVVNITPQIQSGTSEIILKSLTVAATALVSNPIFASSTRIDFQCSYFV